MNYSNLPPSHKFQYWSWIFSLATVLGIVFSYLLLSLSFDLSSLEPFPDHLTLFGIILEEFWDGHFETWLIYQEWLESQNLLEEFYSRLIPPIIIGFMASTYISFKVLYVAGGRTLDKYVRNTKRLKGEAVKKHAQNELRKQLKNNPKDSAGVFLHPDVQITAESEVGNVLITGKPGSGKTVIINHILSQLLARKTKLLIYDEKREYTRILYNPKNTILVAPWDKRSPPWNISKDLAAEGAPENFVKHIIPETSDRIWSNSSRLIMQGLIIALKKSGKPWGWRELYESMIMSDSEIQHQLNLHFPTALRFIEKNNKTTQGIMITLISDLDWIRLLATAWPTSYENGFSVRHWVHGKKSRKSLIVQGNQLYTSVGGPLCNAVMGLMVDEFLSRKKRQSCYLILDELASLPKTESLDLWLKIARDKGGRTVVGTQAISQLKSIYGVTETDSLTSYFSNLIVLKVGSTGETKNYMSDSLGTTVIERPQYTEFQGKTSVNWQQLTQSTVDPTELTQLPIPDAQGVPGFLSINGWNATYEVVWPYPDLAVIAKSEVPAEWLKTKGAFHADEQAMDKETDFKLVPTRICKRREGIKE